MSLTVQVSPTVTLPDRAAVEALVQARVAELQPQLEEANKLYQERLASLNVTTDEVAKLVKANPKLVDSQLRGKLSTASRIEREIATWSSAISALSSVASKISAGTNMFQVTERPWGRSRCRIYVKIIDVDLLLLQKLGLLA